MTRKAINVGLAHCIVSNPTRIQYLLSMHYKYIYSTLYFTCTVLCVLKFFIICYCSTPVCTLYYSPQHFTLLQDCILLYWIVLYSIVVLYYRTVLHSPLLHCTLLCIALLFICSLFYSIVLSSSALYVFFCIVLRFTRWLSKFIPLYFSVMNFSQMYYNTLDIALHISGHKISPGYINGLLYQYFATLIIMKYIFLHETISFVQNFAAARAVEVKNNQAQNKSNKTLHCMIRNALCINFGWIKMHKIFISYTNNFFMKDCQLCSKIVFNLRWSWK